MTPGVFSVFLGPSQPGHVTRAQRRRCGSRVQVEPLNAQPTKQPIINQAPGSGGGAGCIHAHRGGKEPPGLLKRRPDHGAHVCVHGDESQRGLNARVQQMSAAPKQAAKSSNDVQPERGADLSESPIQRSAASPRRRLPEITVVCLRCWREIKLTRGALRRSVHLSRRQDKTWRRLPVRGKCFRRQRWPRLPEDSLPETCLCRAHKSCGRAGAERRFQPRQPQA